MSRARISKSIKEKKRWWQWFLEIIIIAVFASIVVFLILEATKAKVLHLVVQLLFADPRILFIILLNVFICGGALLVLIFQWVDRENIKFRLRQKAYRSMLICKDYYRSMRRIKLDSVALQMPDENERKLDIDHGLRTSDLVTLNYRRLAPEAVKTNIAFDENRHLSGLFKTYFGNGNILAEVSYKNGMLDGRCVIYYVNGNMHNEKYFKEGKLDGIFRAWDEDGALFFEIEYQNDVQHGSDKSYRKNGVIETEDIYEKGILILRKTFDESGRFKFAQNYDPKGREID